MIPFYLTLFKYYLASLLVLKLLWFQALQRLPAWLIPVLCFISFIGFDAPDFLAVFSKNIPCISSMRFAEGALYLLLPH